MTSLTAELASAVIAGNATKAVELTKAGLALGADGYAPDAASVVALAKRLQQQ
ncbi:MAG: hypothetical protein M1531_11730 [Chloroflexi bacterium]|nr:hypothetical protein [Chloroflexota bacterium]